MNCSPGWNRALTPPNLVKAGILRNIRSTLDSRKLTQTYRTPPHAYQKLLDFRPDWFEGVGFDPSSGDGRMILEIITRGNRNRHIVNDVRTGEYAQLHRTFADHDVVIHLGDYLDMQAPPSADFLITNPPFSLAQQFVEKARDHITGPICVLQSIAWQATEARSRWFKTSNLAFVLNIAKRPRFEVDVGRAPNNIWDYAWFVFIPDHDTGVTMDWLF